MAKLKCSVCTKKLSEFTKYECLKCQAVVCVSHLNAVMHTCMFDYKEDHRLKLTKQNVMVVADKIPNKELL